MQGGYNETERLDSAIRKGGFVLKRHGNDHDIYVRGEEEEQIPRHREVNERLAKAILRRWGL